MLPKLRKTTTGKQSKRGKQRSKNFADWVYKRRNNNLKHNTKTPSNC